jgi:hypothetical protein
MIFNKFAKGIDKMIKIQIHLNHHILIVNRFIGILFLFIMLYNKIR